jgi:hypothetical protein
LIEAGPRVLAGMPATLSQSARMQLAELEKQLAEYAKKKA